MDQDADFPCVVEIAIPPAGLGPLLPVILDAVAVCPGPARLDTFAVPPHAERRAWFHWIRTATEDDAQRFERTFRSIGARRVR